MEILYKPGDHLGVFACNRSELVEAILKRVQTPFDPDVPIELQIQKQSHTPNGLFFFFFNIIEIAILLLLNSFFIIILFFIYRNRKNVDST